MPPIDRRPTDTPKSYAALCDYFALGDGRSLDKLVQVYTSSGIANPPTRHRATLGLWSSDHDWQARCQAADAAQRAEAEADRAALRAARRRELEDRDWEQSNTLRNHIDALLAKLPQFLQRTESETTVNGERVKVITLALNTSPGELARSLKLASDVQRLSVGQATEQIDSNQTIEIRYVNDSPDHEAPALGAAEDHD